MSNRSRHSRFRNRITSASKGDSIQVVTEDRSHQLTVEDAATTVKDLFFRCSGIMTVLTDDDEEYTLLIPDSEEKPPQLLSPNTPPPGNEVHKLSTGFSTRREIIAEKTADDLGIPIR